MFKSFSVQIYPMIFSDVLKVMPDLEEMSNHSVNIILRHFVVI